MIIGIKRKSLILKSGMDMSNLYLVGWVSFYFCNKRLKDCVVIYLHEN